MNSTFVPVNVPLSGSIEGLFPDRCSDLTHYCTACYGDAPCANRTHNLMIKSHRLYPASQRVRVSAYHNSATHGRQGNDTKSPPKSPTVVYNRGGP